MSDDLPKIYARRFSDADVASRRAVWRELTRYLQRYVPSDSTVLDLACDRGTFINQIVAANRLAVDRRDVRQHLDSGVQFIQCDGLEILNHIASGSVDVVFISNYLEHLASADVVIEQLKVVAAVLRPGGRAIILQPNIRLVGGSYWDYLDHRTPMTEKSLEEAGKVAGLEMEKLVTRFLPYTTKSRFPQRPWIVRAYLAVPLLWRLFGRQSLYIARRPAEDS